MARIPEAEARLFHRKWVCRKCKTINKADISKVRTGKLICKKCGNKHFRIKRKEKKAVA